MSDEVKPAEKQNTFPARIILTELQKVPENQLVMLTAHLYLLCCQEEVSTWITNTARLLVMSAVMESK